MRRRHGLYTYFPHAVWSYLRTYGADLPLYGADLPLYGGPWSYTYVHLPHAERSVATELELGRDSQQCVRWERRS